MGLKMANDSLIIEYQDIIEFELAENCILQYNIKNDIWSVEKENPDDTEYDEDLIIEESYFDKEDKIDLGEGIFLTKFMFKQFKIIVEGEKNAIRKD